MADFTYTRPTEEDMRELARHLRPEDRRELAGLVGDNIEAACLNSLRASSAAWICKCDGFPLSAFGVAGSPIGGGVIWMLSTTETSKHKIYVGKKTREGIRAFLHDWGYLYNYIDAGNTETIKWLKWMGAKIYPAKPMGLWRLPYHKFTFGE